MTEPENFEDDLFDDLYNDEAPAPPAAAPEPVAPKAEPAPAPGKPEDDQSGGHHGADPAFGEDSHMNGAEEYEEDDDDVDFNLGNGDTHAPDTPSYSQAPAATTHKNPNAKEDG
ncbi:hypothetical protein INS49_012390 [Diaporthe citri]|uniref:uncharacterized protein n=1 Tax=Diaporthe citri TaxID=83186 RepID=UPI001C8131E4|nr:uncharacterized protein INS49_012390 [Diaporthe citri]KAG6358871.1 hypothetical protein INS49_012390 [Diaporthe citri]